MSEGDAIKRHYLGVDGGGTKTLAVVIDHEGHLLGRGRAGACNPITVDEQTALRSLIDAVNEAYLTAGLPPGCFTGAYLGLAGIVTEADRQAVRTMLDKVRLAERVNVHHDCRVALAGATGARPGIVVVSGTGSSAYGINEAGEERLVGGWGYLLGDEGSAYDIGRRAWVSATHAVDGRGPATRLVQAFKEVAGVVDLRQSIPLLYTLDQPAGTKIASYAPLVLKVAESGDPVATAIVEEASRELASLAVDVAKGLRMESQATPIALAGSVLAVDAIGSRVVRMLGEMLPGARVIRPLFDPGIGAALLAAQMDGIRVDEQFLENLRASVESRDRPAWVDVP